MSMLKCFFEPGTNKKLFSKLKISEETALCEEYMGKYPVISVSLKGMNAGNYEKALEMAVEVIRSEARRFQYLLDSERLTSYDKDVISVSLKGMNAGNYEKALEMAVEVIRSEARRFQYLLDSERLTSYDKEAFIALLQEDMKEGTLCSSLKVLSELLEKHHGSKVILLIDEYDVPLAKAFERGYYDQMVLFIRIRSEARRFQYLLDSERLTSYDKEAFIALLQEDMKEGTLCSSLKVLSELLEKHHGSKVILLIDEYDVPLAKAFERGYYDQMVMFVRNMFEYALKTNESLKFAVLTGCMRISKESIFTGLNNLKVLSVADVQFEEAFGFTDKEVRELLEYYELSDHYNEIKEWYDGYQFGNAEVYCPWDVINYCDALRVEPDAQPKNYWSNTSSNEAVRRFIQESDKASVRREIENLVAGEVIKKEIH